MERHVVGRNDPCPCASGRKYKRCHGAIAAARTGGPERSPAAGIAVLDAAAIEGVRRAGRLAASVLAEACQAVRPGVTTAAIDRLVHELTLDAGAYPSPLNYPQPPTDPRHPVIAPRAFPRSSCTSVNDVVCHGIPDDTPLRDGDIVNVDVTCTLDGYFGDTSRTLHVGEPCATAQRLTETTREALEQAIEVVRPGALFWAIGDTIQTLAESRGLSVVREFTGHGIGRRFHEPPAVLHYRDPSMRFPMQAGNCFTIEPMLNAGTHRVRISKADGWTVRTADGSLSAQFEHTVLVTPGGCEVLTAAPVATVKREAAVASAREPG